MAHETNASGGARTEKTEGLIAATHTPMDADGNVRLEGVDRIAAFLARNEVAGAFVNGTTGEGVSLTVRERTDLVERWVSAAPAGFRVIVHVGHACVRESRTMAAHAQDVGAWGIGTMPPVFFRPRTVEDLADVCGEIAAAAPNLPFYYYHIPSMTGARFGMAGFLRLAAEQIPNLRGVKFTDEDLMDYAECLALDGGRFDCLFGRDEILLSALALGARGAIGSTYNFAAPLYRHIERDFRTGDLAAAREKQSLSRRMIQAAVRHGSGVAAFKAIMEMAGVPVGPPRSPVRALREVRKASLRAELDALGFFEWCAK